MVSPKKESVKDAKSNAANFSNIQGGYQDAPFSQTHNAKMKPAAASKKLRSHTTEDEVGPFTAAASAAAVKTRPRTPPLPEDDEDCDLDAGPFSSNNGVKRLPGMTAPSSSSKAMPLRRAASLSRETSESSDDTIRVRLPARKTSSLKY